MLSPAAAAQTRRSEAAATQIDALLEIELAGKYLDILRYVQTLESLDWKLLWDEIEINSDEYPKATVKVAISTLSTRKEWVGI